MKLLASHLLLVATVLIPFGMILFGRKRHFHLIADTIKTMKRHLSQIL